MLDGVTEISLWSLPTNSERPFTKRCLAVERRTFNGTGVSFLNSITPVCACLYNLG
jgi:hypothetical protein